MKVTSASIQTSSIQASSFIGLLSCLSQRIKLSSREIFNLGWLTIEFNCSEYISCDKLLLVSAEDRAPVETDSSAARPLQAGQAFSACPFGWIGPACNAQSVKLRGPGQSLGVRSAEPASVDKTRLAKDHPGYCVGIGY